MTIFQNFVKTPNIQNVLLLFCYCHDAEYMYNENSFTIFIGNHFFFFFLPKNAILHFLQFTLQSHYLAVLKEKSNDANTRLIPRDKKTVSEKA